MTFGEGDFGTGYFGGEPVTYMAVGTLEAWNALSPAEQAFYGGGHYLDYNLATNALPATPTENWTLQSISDSSLTAALVTPDDSSFNNKKLIFDLNGFVLNDNFTNHTIEVNITGFELNNGTILRQSNKVADRSSVYNPNPSGSMSISHVVFDGNSYDEIMVLYDSQVFVSFCVFKNLTSSTFGALVRGGGYSGPVSTLKNLTFYNNQYDLRDNMLSADHEIKNTYAKFRGSFTDLGGNASLDTSAPEVTRQNRAPVDSFEDLVDFIPKDVAWMEGVEITEFSEYLNGVTTVNNYWTGANGRAVVSGGTPGGGSAGLFFDDAFIWG
jgi:hypothetical protein